MSDDLMPCWVVDSSNVGLYCKHPSVHGIEYVLQQASNGWLLVFADDRTGEAAAVHILEGIEAMDVAGAQHMAHEIMNRQIYGMEAVMDFYEAHDPADLAMDWHGPDPMGGYGRVIDGALFMINDRVTQDDSGNYVLARLNLFGRTNDDVEAFQTIEGGELADVQKRAFLAARSWGFVG